MSFELRRAVIKLTWAFAALSAINTAKPSTELTRLISFVRSMDQSPQAIRHLASLYPNGETTR